MALKILLIDDELEVGDIDSSRESLSDPEFAPNYMWYYAKALEESDNAVTCIDRTTDAISLIGKGAEFDLVILDMGFFDEDLPDSEDDLERKFGGLHVARAIAELSNIENIVILTNYQRPDLDKVLHEIPQVREIVKKVSKTPMEFAKHIRALYTTRHGAR